MNIEECLYFTHRNKVFYQYGPTRLRGIRASTEIIVFFNEDMKSLLLREKVWSIDGTFSVCPSPWKQLYTISVIIDHHVIPVVYALLRNKNERSYNELILVSKKLIEGISPDIIIADFELAALNSFKRYFPGCRVTGCLFHLSQNITKKIQSLGLSDLYSNDLDVLKFTKALKCF